MNQMNMNYLSVERCERGVVAVRRDAKGVRGGRGRDVARGGQLGEDLGARGQISWHEI